MQIDTITNENETILVLKGRLDVTWAEHVLNSALELLRAGQHKLDLDAAGLEYLSSAGIRVLIRIRREVAAVQGSFSIINASPFAENTLRMSGLTALDAPIVPEALCSATAEQSAPAVENSATATGIQVDIHALMTGATISVRAPAVWHPWRPVQDSDITSVSLPSSVFALGIGAPGTNAADTRSRFGEFAAISGCLNWLPADGGDTPDYLIQAEQFVPSLFAIQALVAQGEFSHLVRFRPRDKSGLLPLSALLEHALQVTSSDAAALVCIAEIEGLVGIALARSPGLITGADSPGSFPQVRDWMAFCGERVHTRQSALLVSFAARHPDQALASHLTPLPAVPGLFAHTHAAVFPFQPLPEGVIDLDPHIRMFYENTEPVDLLHLIEDDRPAVGLGESAFLRGACWCAPFTFGKENLA